MFMSRTAKMVQRKKRALQQVICILRNILSSRETITSLPSSVERQRTGSSVLNVVHSSAESEMRQLFRPPCSQDTSAGQVANATQGQPMAASVVSDAATLWHQRPPNKKKTLVSNPFYVRCSSNNKSDQEFIQDRLRCIVLLTRFLPHGSALTTVL
ncbi:hypothetical protein GBF38_014621 [Nibea albiflora]|uniref:Uncharacterized protein n=1 Tax=Nibea albiflora TaxID=240163 RepID=A0ACB7F798_NIBAL|nr:hypothetical protein GBF38_014621 [Nibea albiflora]